MSKIKDSQLEDEFNINARSESFRFGNAILESSVQETIWAIGARALQKSMLALIDGPGLKDDATSKIIASYAHPLFWAPFIVVGEGSGNDN